MSIFDTAIATCPACGEDSAFDVVMSVNADRRPELRDEILAGTFQRAACPNCGASLRVPPEFTYLELRAGHWITVHPPQEVKNWQLCEQAAQEAFDTGFGADAPAPAQELGARLATRMVFGWAALEEKLLAGSLGLDDSVLELLKVALLRDAQGLVIGEDSELRLSGGDADMLVLDWLHATTGEAVNRLQVGRAAYDEIAADPEPWQDLRSRIAGSMFVDLQRATVAES